MSDEECKTLLLQLIDLCKTVVFCRVSPDQKRLMVEFIQNNCIGVRSLAVGDGANDVAMITAADVGVGIQGEEGTQAVNSSDYAIGQFRFLVPLLMKQGRRNYIRMSNVVLYIFYKNILFSMTLFWVNFKDAYSEYKVHSYTLYSIVSYTLYPSTPLPLYPRSTRKRAFNSITSSIPLYPSYGMESTTTTCRMRTSSAILSYI